MSITPDPWDQGEGEKPANTSQANTDLDAWRADMNRAIVDISDKIGRAIARVNDNTEILLAVIGALEKFIPLIQAGMGAGAAVSTSTTVGPLKSLLESLKAKCASGNCLK